MLICWVHLYGHSITGVWGLETCWGGLETVAEEVAEEVWKLLLTHCPCLRPGGRAASVVWTCPELPSSWKQRSRPSLLNCQFEACHGVSLSQSSHGRVRHCMCMCRDEYNSAFLFKVTNY